VSKFGRFVLLAAALAIGIFFVKGFFESDETRIRNLILGLVGDFNEHRSRSLLDTCTADFTETTTGLGRERIREALGHAFLTLRNTEGRFPYALAIRRSPLEVSFETPEKLAATAIFGVSLHRGADERSPVEWEIEVRARLRKTDDGWRFSEAEHKTSNGRRPF
jgi:hypothetical protein